MFPLLYNKPSYLSRISYRSLNNIQVKKENYNYTHKCRLFPTTKANMFDIEYAQKIISVVTRMGIFCVHSQHMDIDNSLFEACRCSISNIIMFVLENPVCEFRLTKMPVQIASVRNFAKPHYRLHCR